MIFFQCKEGSFSNEMFMTVIKTTNSVEELASVIDIVDCDIARWRSKDTGGNDGRYYLFTTATLGREMAAIEGLNKQ